MTLIKCNYVFYIVLVMFAIGQSVNIFVHFVDTNFYTRTVICQLCEDLIHKGLVRDF